MGSSSFAQMGMGNGRSASSRKGKKSNPDKPKQPQRGLGVAQLEKIRLQMAGFVPPPFHSDLNQSDPRVQMARPSSPSSSIITTSSSTVGLHPNIGFGDSSGASDFRCSEIYSGATSRSSHDGHHLAKPTVTLPLLEQTIEKNRWYDRQHLAISHFDSSSSPDLDLELKLSL